MVAFTTADYLRLTDNARFNAVGGAADLLLTAAPVAAFGFLGNNPTAIAIQGSTLQVAQGQSLLIVGGNQGFIATDPDTGNPIPVPGGITMTGGTLSQHMAGKSILRAWQDQAKYRPWTSCQLLV